MALREYVDASGASWQVWHVVPTTRAITPAIPNDRRKQAAGDLPTERRKRGITLTPGMEGGWLCFESAAQKRRLMPVPGDWESCPDEAIARYPARATPVSRRIIEEPGSTEMRPTQAR